MKKIKPNISPFNNFPDHMILHILNKLIDLKTLCICKPVSKRFNSIISQIDTVSFTVTRPDNDTSLLCKSFLSAVKSMCKFKTLKTLCIDFPSVCYNEYIESRCLFKFRNNKFRSFLFVSPNAVYDKNGTLLLPFRKGNVEEDEEVDNLSEKKVEVSIDCFSDTFIRSVMLLHCIVEFPSLEEISITDCSKKRVFLVCGRKLRQVKDWVDETSEELYCIDRPSKVSKCFIPSLELRGSGYVMKGVSAVFCEWGDGDDDDDDDDGDSLMSGFGYDVDEDKQKADAYREAMTLLDLMMMLERLRQ